MVRFESANTGRVVFSSGGASAVLFRSLSGGGGPEPIPDLSVYRDTDPYGPDSLYDTYAGPIVDVHSMENDACDPVRLVGGSAVTDLTFRQCANLLGGIFSINDLSQFQGNSLTNLTFNAVGQSGITLSDTSNLTNLTNLTFEGGSAFLGTILISDTSGLTNLTNLSISFGNNITLPDTSGLLSLANFSMSYSYGLLYITDTIGFNGILSMSFSYNYGSFNITDTTNVMPEAAALVMLNALASFGYYGPSNTVDILVDGDASLGSAITTLQGQGTNITVTVFP